MIRNWYNQIPHPALKTKINKYTKIDGSLRKALAVNRMNSSFPNRWSFSYLKFTKYVTNIIAETLDGWVSVLRPFNSISVIQRRWKGEHERLCAMKRRLGSGRISPPAGFEPATPWSKVGSANRSATRTLPLKPKYKYGQQEQVTIRNHNRSTALERSV